MEAWKATTLPKLSTRYARMYRLPTHLASHNHGNGVCRGPINERRAVMVLVERFQISNQQNVCPPTIDDGSTPLRPSATV